MSGLVCNVYGISGRFFANSGGTAGVNALVPVFQGQGLFCFLLSGQRCPLFTIGSDSDEVKELMQMEDGWWQKPGILSTALHSKRNLYCLTFGRNLS